MAARDGGLQIPNKLYFRIGEVSEITGVQPYTLRHWEMEFPTLSPKKNDSGQRLYRKEDIEMVHTIQRLLHSEGYTTAGARRLLSAKSGKRGRPAVPKPPPAPEPEARPPSRPEVAEGRARRPWNSWSANDKLLASPRGIEH